ncbi:hypothetical protein PRZ48_005251 [Zasmidium cellare]|uniref:SprT-like domain-containing protein n=1 Tax=Zasmidium cellare TaxID=395010 RepID=A0ABR0ES84_ZASCE|nr:hypothetical protein PRZ48_005251 [Zasmidium cellare]
MRARQKELAKWDEEAGANGRLRRACDEQAKVPSEDSMKYLITLIGAIFFFCRLDHVKFSWQPGLRSRKGPYGKTISRWIDGMWEKEVEIVMDPNDWHEEKRVRDHFSALMGTLLHECAHAFLDSFSCDGYCEADACRVSRTRVEGGSGHGSAWFRVVTYVEACANANMYGQWKLGLENGMWSEVWKEERVIGEEDIRLCHPRYQQYLRYKGREVIREWRSEMRVSRRVSRRVGRRVSRR